MRSLSLPIILLMVLAVAAGTAATVWFIRRMQRRAQIERIKQRWLTVQRKCAQPKLWSEVVIDGDTLIDDALKTLGYKGRSMGERLVAAQRKLTDNDGVWFGHKLRNKINQEEMTRLYKRDVQAALRGTRQALQDLGVLS